MDPRLLEQARYFLKDTALGNARDTQEPGTWHGLAHGSLRRRPACL
jgi:hypothetical protein